MRAVVTSGSDVRSPLSRSVGFPESGEPIWWTSGVSYIFERWCREIGVVAENRATGQHNQEPGAAARSG